MFSLVALIPLCENMPSGTAIKPGDIVTAMNGKTIEVKPNQYILCNTTMLHELKLFHVLGSKGTYRKARVHWGVRFSLMGI